MQLSYHLLGDLILYDVRIISDKKVFVCSRALARTVDRAKALLQALIITIQPDMILHLKIINFSLTYPCSPKIGMS